MLRTAQYTLPSDLVFLSCTSNILVLALAGGASDAYPSSPHAPRLIRIDLNRPDEEEFIDLPIASTAGQRHPGTSPVSIHRLFCDPSGRHILVSTSQAETFYVFDGWSRDAQSQTKRARPLGKLRGLLVDSVAWNPSRLSAASTSTREILLGTSDGRTFETWLDGEPESSRPFGRGQHDRYLKPVFTLPEKQAITGLRFEVWQSSRKGRRRAVVIATTSTRIYQFVSPVGNGTGDDGTSLFDALSTTFREATPSQFSLIAHLSPYLEAHPRWRIESLELPGDIPYSELHFWQAQREEPDGRVVLEQPKSVAWLTGRVVGFLS
jgi:vacuolar protein sorting-associated protein 18